MNYDQYVSQMQLLLKYPAGGSDNSGFLAWLPNMIQYAELRIYRELDFLSTVTTATANLVANTRSVTVPATIIVVQSANAVTPAATAPDAGTRVPLERVSLDFLNMAYPSAVTTGVPRYYAALNDTSFMVGPTPDAAYRMEFIGTQRPDPLTKDNPETFISVNVPDLFIAASAIFGFGMQRDFGGQADDPRAAMSWEKIYTDLRAGVQIEDLRRKAQSVGWSPYQPSPAANVPRDRNAAG